MILLLEPHPRARDLLTRELTRGDNLVQAPDLARVTPGEAIAAALQEGKCRLVVIASELPGTKPGSIVKVLRSYSPTLPVVVMTKGEFAFPPLDGVVTVSYQELGSLLGPTVSTLLAESGDFKTPSASRCEPTEAMTRSA